ncbi:MAG: sigma-54-dependent Fis family transcriptional regulator [Syntrophales bacterium]|nr:sigma-54-dependent Fis family transcriptional regulator [Syntrophales bacterium]
MQENYRERFDQVLREWKRFINSQPFDNPLVVPDVIHESWRRCQESNVNPYTTRVDTVLDAKALGELLERNAELIEISRPFMQNLYGFVRGSGFVVALFDEQGFLLEVIGDADVVERIRKGNFVPGACWSEEEAGTNGCGTVLKMDRPVQVFATEHYCINSHKWTCSGAPIHDPDGDLIGVIDMTGPYLNANPHTLGMVAAAAYAIENDMRVRKALSECRIADGYQRTVLASIPEALIAIDTLYRITMVNENAEKIIGLGTAKLAGRSLHDVMGEHNTALFNLIRHNATLTDVEARIVMRDGHAVDYTLTCNPIRTEDRRVIGRLIILNEIKRARTLVTRMIGAKAKFSFDDVCGVNAAFLETVNQAKRVSQSNSNVLLLGESGTGKDVFAQAIHNESGRSAGPYVAINCAAIPRDLIASELFGYSEGAFTGSKRGGNQGKFELADGGTIFLDEIAEMPLELQAALLRVIEDKSITRIGGSRVTSVDVRIIAATNKNLKEEVRKGRFREDLYYRFNVFTIHMVPLRDRPEDIPLLVDGFVRKLCDTMGKKLVRVDGRVLEKFMGYAWPGNVRELQNVIERMMNIVHTDELTADLIPSEVRHGPSRAELPTRAESPRDVERRILEKMVRSGIPKQEIARRMQMARSTLYRKLEKYNLPR